MDPRRSDQLGNRLRRTQSARRLYTYLGVSRLDQSNPTILSVSAKERIPRSKFALLRRADSYERLQRSPSRRTAPSAGAVSQVQFSGKKKFKRFQRGNSQRSVCVLRTRTTCGATDSIFVWNCDVHAISRANPMCCNATVKGQRAVSICNIGDTVNVSDKHIRVLWQKIEIFDQLGFIYLEFIKNS